MTINLRAARKRLSGRLGRALRVEHLERRALLAGELTATLVGPADNDAAGVDLNPEIARVHVDTADAPDRFVVRLTAEAGLDTATITAGRFQLQRNGELLVVGTDYHFSFDEATGEAALVATATFPLESLYEITLDNTTETGIKDLAGNPLDPTRDDGTTRFTILLTDGVNAAPENQVPADQVTAEDVPVIFGQSLGNAIAVMDSDAALGDGALQVTLAAEHGVLTLAALTDLEFHTGDGSEDSVVQVRGLAAAINAALDGLQLIPEPNYFGPVSLVVATNDLGNFAGPDAAPQEDVDTISIDVASVNDAPVNSIPSSQTIEEDGELVLDADHENLVSVADVDAGEGILQVTLAAENGWVRVLPVPDITFGEGSGNQRATVVFSGKLPDIQAALAQVTFRSNPHYFGPASLTITTQDDGPDGTPLSDTDTIEITVSGSIDAPINETPPQRQSIDEDTPLMFTAERGNPISILDLDVPDGAGEIGLSLLAVNGTLDLDTVEGLTFSSGDGVQDTLINLTGTVAQINAALATLRFTPSADYAGPARLVVVSSKPSPGGSPLTDLDLIEIDVLPVNDAPLNLVPGEQSTSEDQPLIFSAANGNAISIRDVDLSDTTSVLEVSLSVTHGLLSLESTAGLTFSEGDGASDAGLTFSGALSDLAAALASVQFTPEENYSGPAQLTAKTNDLGNTGAGGPLSDEDTVGLNIFPINDLPVAVNDGRRAHQGVSVVIDVLKNDFDVDGTLNPGSVRIVTQPEHGTAAVNGDGTITYTADEEYSGLDSFTYSVEDNDGAESNNAVVALTVNANPRAEDDQAGTRPNTDITIDVLQNDSDSDGTLDPATLAVSSGPEHGTVSVDESGTITYTPNTGFTGVDTFQYRVQDDCGGVSNEATVTVRVLPEFPFQNQRSRFDVNDDGHVSAIDVLLIVNLINLNPNFPGPLPNPPSPPFLPPPFYDVSGDNHVSAEDAILVISHINSRDQDAEEGEAAEGEQGPRRAEGEAVRRIAGRASLGTVAREAVAAGDQALVFPIDLVAGFATAPRRDNGPAPAAALFSGPRLVETERTARPVAVDSVFEAEEPIEVDSQLAEFIAQSGSLDSEQPVGELEAADFRAADLQADLRDRALLELLT